MNMINDGGPAFPVWELNGKDQPEMTGFGMTLRDYFAAKAMHGFSTNIDTRRSNLIDVPQLAKSSYNIADAMLKARGKAGQEVGNG
jgi:hypothetical protein